MKNDDFSWLRITTLTTTFGVIGVSSIVINNNKDSLSNFDEITFDLSWICLFLYTTIVAFIAYYLGSLVNSSSSTQELTQYDYNSLKNKFFKLRSQLKFLLISRYIQNQSGLNELKKKLQGIESEEDTVDSKYERQKNELADAILNCYIFSWYNNISDDKIFPVLSKRILLSILTQLDKKVQQIDRISLAKEVILLLHCHWIEYCSMLEKTAAVKNDSSILQNFKALHSYFDNKEELAKQYQALISLLLKDVVTPELQSDLFCQFLSGILVKGFVFYYADLICDPKWLNTKLVNLISSTGNCNKDPNCSFVQSILTPSSHTPTLSLNVYDDSKSSNNSNDEADDENVQESKTVVENDVPKLEENIEIRHNVSPNSLGLIRLPCSGLTTGENSFILGNNQKLTISSALNGLLSTAALPLLPDGSTYDNEIHDFQTISEAGQKSNSPLSPLPVSVETVVTKESRNDSSDDGNKCKENKNQDAVHNNRIRHVSVNHDTHKQQNHLEKSTQSLDENKINNQSAHHEVFESSLESSSENKIDSSNFKKNVSPMYEETEDFAATIRKLRSLLEQKDSRSNLTDATQTEKGDSNSATTAEVSDDTTSTDTKKSNEENKIVKQNSNPITQRQNLNSQSSTGTEGSSGSSTSRSCLDSDRLDSIEDVLDENDLEIRHIFLNVIISKTEAYGGESSSAQSVLFCIQYEGVYVEDEDDETNQKLVLRTTIVKRRFKEFLTLQSQLEENPIWKPHLKQIKTPNKWLTLSFPNQNSISQKKAFLEKYLQQICYHPILGFSPELRQFMAYGEDGFRAFEMLTSNSISFHRLDKLAKTFTGVFNSLKDVLPSFESDNVLPSSRSPDDTESKGRFSPNDPKAKKMFASFFNFGEKVSAQKVKNQELLAEEENTLKEPLNKIENNSTKPVSELNTENSESLSIESMKEDKSVSSDEENTTPADSIRTIDGSLDSMYPLASVFTQLLCDVLWLPPNRPHETSIAAFMSISGKSLDNYLQESLKILLSEDAFTIYLGWLTCSINEWMRPDISINTNQEEILPEYTQKDLKNCLKQKIPVWARWIWGRKRLEQTVDRLSGFCQHMELNHDFILSLVELFFSKMTENCNEISDIATTEEESV